jgi:hypothetical protein
MMNSLFRKYGLLTTAAVLAFASASFAQTTQVTLTGVGNGTTVGGVFVDPYTATVGGVPNTTVICDDWSDNSYVPENWTANVTPLSNAGSSSTPLFSNAANPQQLYNELAYLGSQLLSVYSPSPSPAQQTAQSEITFAIWELTYPYAQSPENPSPSTYLNTYAPGDAGAVAAYIAAAQTAIAQPGFSAAGWEILTPNTSDAITCNGGPCPSSPPQEFLVYTPESSSVILFGADALGLLALAFMFRRRLLLPVR